jgi:proteasome lid subunit RPN8/RPN11
VLTILRTAITAASAAAAEALPYEIVGFLAGPGAGPGAGPDHLDASLFVQLANLSDDPHRFDVDPAAQFRAERQIAAAGLTRIAIIHSHPYGGVSLSPTDVEFARLRSELQVVMSVDPNRPPRIAAYRVEPDGRCTPLELSVDW